MGRIIGSAKFLSAFLCLFTSLVFSAAGAELPQYEMVRIRAGFFIMGSPATENLSREDEQMHRVTLTRDFFMGRFEVTQDFYQEIMGINPSYNNVCPECPVEMISWQDAVTFCNAVSQKENLTPAYNIDGSRVVLNLDSPGYRLPTEAEWEYACRAGARSIFPNGQCLSSSEANINGYIPQPGCAKGLNRGQTIPVGQFAPNGWGLYDITGNVNELCWDWYEHFSAEDQTDPLGAAAGDKKVFRGGAFNNNAANCHSASRQLMTPEKALDMVGLRLVRTAAALRKGGS